MSGGMDDARTFLESVTGFVETPPSLAPPSQDRPVRLAVVAPGYTSGMVPVIFDGETVAGARAYAALAPVATGQRVVLLPVGSTYVVLGAISGGGSVGDIIEGLWTTAPAGFLLLEGQVVLRADYPGLFALIGTTYNTGGETGSQFRLPNGKRRFLVGRDSAGGAYDTVGELGGTENETLSVAQMPAHNHGGTTGTTTPEHDYSTGDGPNGSPRSRAGSNSSGRYTASLQGGEHNHSIPSQGGGGSHNNMPLYMVVNRAVRYC